MWVHRALVAVLALGLFGVIAAASGPRRATEQVLHVYAAQFPAGAGKPIADRSCTACHSPMLITQQAKDSTAWEKTVGTMQKWGVALTPAEHDSLRDYLVERFGPRGAAPR